MTPWGYESKPLNEVPKDAYGFTYRITIAGCSYYGKKNFYSNRKVKLGKKELALQTDKRLKNWKLVTKESGWETYCSSSKEVKALVTAGNLPVRQVLDICYSAKELTYRENCWLYRCIEEDNNLNDNLSGKIFMEEINTWNK